MRLGHIELEVSDPVTSSAFYTDRLGFDLLVNQGDQFIWIERGGLQIMLRHGQAGAGKSIVFYSSDVERDLAELRERGAPLEQKGPCTYIHDPDGHEFQLVDPGADFTEEA